MDCNRLVERQLPDLAARSSVIDLHGVREKITIDKSGANTAAIVGLCTDSGAEIELRQSKYLNNWLTTITLAGRRQLSWPVQTDAGRAREAGLP